MCTSWAQISPYTYFLSSQAIEHPLITRHLSASVGGWRASGTGASAGSCGGATEYLHGMYVWMEMRTLWLAP